MSTAKDVSVRLDAVTYHLAAAMCANGCEFVNCALETIKNVTLAGRDHLKSQIVLIPTNLAWLHIDLSLTEACPELPGWSQRAF